MRKIQPRGWNKKKRNNTDLGQLQAQEREFVTLCILRAIVDYRGRVFCAKLLQKLLEMLTHLWLSSLTASICWLSSWTAILRRLVSSAHRCQLTLCDFSGTFLPSSTSSLAGDLAFGPLCRFRAKTDKEIVWVAPTQTKRIATHCVTTLLKCISTVKSLTIHFYSKTHSNTTPG